ncbi:MAG: hypothetical protein K0B81_05850 [Candidatus Cloacimonetes bacterium]|nr:hypothetical protein [Candidatus Cloacimonadota bacterium]
MIVSKSKFNSVLQSPASEKNLYLMPLFTNQKFTTAAPENLHKSYHPDVSISNLILNIRSINLLKQANISTIGQLLLTPYGFLLKFRNCGIHTIHFLQNELKKYIIDKEIDYSSNWHDLESMLINVIELKNRNFIIFKDRLGIGLHKPMTLEECGDKFGITREAVRQIMTRIDEIILHPETEFKLRPFWITVDKLLKKREVWTSEELAKKIRENLLWKKKPETHALENFLSIKDDKYTVTHNGLIGFHDSKCLNCPKIDGFLPDIMKGRSEISYSEATEKFIEKFEDFCPLVKSYPRKVIDALVRLHLYQQLRSYRQYQMRNNKIIDILTYVPKRRRRI